MTDFDPTPATAPKALRAQVLPVYREMCWACRKSKLTCYCRWIRSQGRVQSKISFVILQHPKESKHLIGTGRLAHLALAESFLLDGIDFTNHAGVQELLSDPKRDCAILYPGPTSKNIRVALEATEPSKQLTLFVLDGTWDSVRSILRLSKNLQNLPRLSFAVERPSAYEGVRKQPRPDCLSTVEAIARVIEEVEGAESANRLLAPFLGMVKQQLEFGENSTVRSGGVRTEGDRKRS